MFFRSARKPLMRTPTSTPVRRRPSIDFSFTGLVYISMMLFMGLAAINSQANLLFGVFGLMIGILLISGVLSRLMLRRLRIRRTLPEHGVVGQTMTIRYEFTNHKRFWPSLSVCLGELDGAEAFVRQPQTYLLHAAPRMTAVVPMEVVCKRRGLHALNSYQVSTSFPFGFIKRAVERSHKDTLLIYPALAAVSPRIIQMARSAEKTGATVRPRRGGQDEFYGVKEFRSGENPRWIYWRRSARTGVLVAKEMTQVSPPKLLLLVDTCVEASADDESAAHASVEKVIAMAGSLASHAIEARLAVGLFAWSDGWMDVPPNRGKRHRRELLGVLARLPINRAHSTQDLLDNSHEFLKSGTTAVLITPRDVQLGLSESRRGGMLVISAHSAMADRLFEFAPNIDFARCMPPEQQPMMKRGQG